MFRASRLFGGGFYRSIVPWHFRFFFAYNVLMFDPNAHMPRINRGMIYLGACLTAGIRLARNKQVNVQVVPTSVAIEESVDLAHEIYNRVFRKVPERLIKKSNKV
jgi:hypothetical protein